MSHIFAQVILSSGYETSSLGAGLQLCFSPPTQAGPLRASLQVVGANSKLKIQRFGSVQGRAGVSPAPLGRKSERANSKIPAYHFLVMPADIARSNETNC